MQEGAGPEWDHIDQPTLEEVEKSWAHSRCRGVELDISVSMCVCVSQVEDHKRNHSKGESGGRDSPMVRRLT